MSKESNIEKSDDWFVNEAKVFRFLIVDAADAPLDVSTFTLAWTAERRDTDRVAKSGAAITVANGDGTNDAVSVVVDAADTVDLTADRYNHALRRTDAGSEQVLSYGYAILQKAAAAG